MFIIVSIALTDLVLSYMIRSRSVTVNPEVVKVDQAIFQLQNSNNQLSNNVSVLQAEVIALNSSVSTLAATKNNLIATLASIIASQSIQIVIIPDHEVSDELILLVDLRTDILQYMNTNFIPGTNYLKTSPFYQAIDTLIGNYLSTTTLTLSEFLDEFDDTNTVNFRQAIQLIYDNTLPYNFDAFYTSLANPP